MDKIGFKHIRDNEDNDGNIYEATFPLRDDECPGSEQSMRVRVITHDSLPSEIVVEIITMSGTKVRTVGKFESDNIEAVACMLYGAARLKVRRFIEPA